MPDQDLEKVFDSLIANKTLKESLYREETYNTNYPMVHTKPLQIQTRYRKKNTRCATKLEDRFKDCQEEEEEEEEGEMCVAIG